MRSDAPARVEPSARVSATAEEALWFGIAGAGATTSPFPSNRAGPSSGTRRPARRWSRRLLQKSCETTALSSSMTASPPSIMVVAERLHLQPPCNPCHVFLFCALFSATGFSHPHRRGIKHPPWWFQRALVSANHRGGNGEGGRERTAGAIGRAVGKRLVS